MDMTDIIFVTATILAVFSAFKLGEIVGKERYKRKQPKIYDKHREIARLYLKNDIIKLRTELKHNGSVMDENRLFDIKCLEGAREFLGKF